MTTERLISPASRGPDEEQLSFSLRPRSLDEFVGQRDLLTRISIAVRAARQRGESMEHVLLHGPPGCGKTLLANAIAGSLGDVVYFRSVAAPEIVSGMSGDSEKRLRELFDDAKAHAPAALS